MYRAIIFLAIFLFSLNVMGSNFSHSPIPPNIKKEIIEKGIWKEGCPVPPERLELLNVSYYDFEGKEHKNGKIIVMDASASYVLNIFKNLYEQKFPIAGVKLINEYNGDDKLSMADNNSSAFNCRITTGGSLPSVHSYGLAIDINPIQNPFVSVQDKAKGTAEIQPAKGLEYINHGNQRAGMTESIVGVFEKNGFTIWGGKWNDPIDWQHFQISRSVAMILAAMIPEDAKKFFESYITTPQIWTKTSYEKDAPRLIELYKDHKIEFMNALDQFQKNPKVFTDISVFIKIVGNRPK